MDKIFSKGFHLRDPSIVECAEGAEVVLGIPVWVDSTISIRTAARALSQHLLFQEILDMNYFHSTQPEMSHEIHSCSLVCQWSQRRLKLASRKDAERQKIWEDSVQGSYPCCHRWKKASSSLSLGRCAVFQAFRSFPCRTSGLSCCTHQCRSLNLFSEFGTTVCCCAGRKQTCKICIHIFFHFDDDNRLSQKILKIFTFASRFQ